MPFIRGRYHINAIAGEALEAAREAEAALLALEHDAAQVGGEENEHDDEIGSASGADKGPIHRVEIEAAELVPSHSGRAQRGFVAHVHRGAGSSSGASGADSPLPGQLPSRGYAAKPETHAFVGHGDLLDFLKNELQNQ